MDVRVLKYFLGVAREGNITKAAETLNVTQPTLSRQLMDLEHELGTELLIRGKRHVTLTSSGILFQQRAQEIVALLDKAARDIAEYDGTLGGVISIGCVESIASLLLPDALQAFSSQHPMVQYEIYSANGDDIRSRIDSGHIDIGILVEPVETAKYEFIPLAFYDTWGVFMRKDDPLAKKDTIRFDDIIDLPLIIPQRRIVTDQIESWAGNGAKNLRVFAYMNLMTNAMLLIERGLGYGVSIQGANLIRPNENIRFVPLSPERKSGHVLAWKKNRVFGAAASHFLEYVKNTFSA
jgi:DNA-binding transcriptional LysR family regulator